MNKQLKRSLTTMGKAWFISRLYYEEIDNKHQNWRLAETLASRECCFKKVKNLCLDLLLDIRKNCSAVRLATNKIGLSAERLNAMLEELIKKLSL